MDRCKLPCHRSREKGGKGGGGTKKKKKENKSRGS